MSKLPSLWLFLPALTQAWQYSMHLLCSPPSLKLWAQLFNIIICLFTHTNTRAERQQQQQLCSRSRIRLKIRLYRRRLPWNKRAHTHNTQSPVDETQQLKEVEKRERERGREGEWEKERERECFSDSTIALRAGQAYGLRKRVQKRSIKKCDHASVKSRTVLDLATVFSLFFNVTSFDRYEYGRGQGLNSDDNECIK